MNIYEQLGVVKEGTIIACPHCHVYSVCLEDFLGQEIAKCNVCGHDIELAQFRVKQEPNINSLGEWLEDYETFIDDSGHESYPIQTGYICSECEKDGNVTWRFCPNCGTKMGNAVL